MSDDYRDAPFPQLALREMHKPLINRKIEELIAAGHSVTPSEGIIPGLWRVDNGPELTTNQLLGLSLPDYENGPRRSRF